MNRITAAAVVAGLATAVSGQGCNPADLAEPYGTLDLADVSAFAGAFVDGCQSLDLVEAYRSWVYGYCFPWPPYDCWSVSDAHTGFGEWADGYEDVYQVSWIDDSGAWGDLIADISSPDAEGETDLSFTFETHAATLIESVAWGDGGYGIEYVLERLAPTIGVIPLDTSGVVEHLMLEPGMYALSARASGGSLYQFSFRVSDTPHACSPADLAEPFGVLGLADVVAFVDAFVAGCP